MIATCGGRVDIDGITGYFLVVQLQLNADADVVGQIDLNGAGRGVEVEDVMPIVQSATGVESGAKRAGGLVSIVVRLALIRPIPTF